jgi:hypothetical protein
LQASFFWASSLFGLYHHDHSGPDGFVSAGVEPRNPKNLPQMQRRPRNHQPLQIHQTTPLINPVYQTKIFKINNLKGTTELFDNNKLGREGRNYSTRKENLPITRPAYFFLRVLTAFIAHSGSARRALPTATKSTFPSLTALSANSASVMPPTPTTGTSTTFFIPSAR